MKLLIGFFSHNPLKDNYLSHTQVRVILWIGNNLHDRDNMRQRNDPVKQPKKTLHTVKTLYITFKSPRGHHQPGPARSERRHQSGGGCCGEPPDLTDVPSSTSASASTGSVRLSQYSRDSAPEARGGAALVRRARITAQTTYPNPDI